MHSVSSDKKPPTVSMQQMTIGQVGLVVDDDHRGHLLRTFSGWVLLERPASTWSGNGPNMQVEILPPGTVLTLTLGA